MFPDVEPSQEAENEANERIDGQLKNDGRSEFARLGAKRGKRTYGEVGDEEDPFEPGPLQALLGVAALPAEPGALHAVVVLVRSVGHAGLASVKHLAAAAPFGHIGGSTLAGPAAGAALDRGKFGGEVVDGERGRRARA